MRPTHGSKMSSDLPLGGSIGGYRLLSHLGGGGFADVYIGEDTRPQISRRVAIKVARMMQGADPAFRERFLRESLVTGRLNHPNIVPVFDAGEDRGHLYIVMPLVEGQDLATHLRQRGRVDGPMTLKVVTSVGAALDAAHGQGVLHRDVKPANILVVGDFEHVYLADFGLTKPVQAATSGGLTMDGRIFGTLQYLSPEQIEGHADPRTDVYALGCVMVECLTGRPPFAEHSGTAIFRAHLLEPPPSVTARRPDLPTSVDSVAERALAKLPGDRFPTGGALGGGAAPGPARRGHRPDPVDHVKPTVIAAAEQRLRAELRPDPPTQTGRRDARAPGHAHTAAAAQTPSPSPTPQFQSAPQAPGPAGPPRYGAPYPGRPVRRRAHFRRPQPPAPSRAESRAVLVTAIVAGVAVLAVGITLAVVVAGQGEDFPTAEEQVLLDEVGSSLMATCRRVAETTDAAVVASVTCEPASGADTVALQPLRHRHPGQQAFDGRADATGADPEADCEDAAAAVHDFGDADGRAGQVVCDTTAGVARITWVRDRRARGGHPQPAPTATAPRSTPSGPTTSSGAPPPW